VFAQARTGRVGRVWEARAQIVWIAIGAGLCLQLLGCAFTYHQLAFASSCLAVQQLLANAQM